MNVNSSAPRATSGAAAPAGFHPAAHYDFHIDLDGDAVEEVTYRVTFGPLDRAERQPIELRRLVGAEAREHTAIGALVAWGTTGCSLTGSDDLRLWAGRAAESFSVAPTVLQAIRAAVRLGRTVDLAAWQPGRAVNAFAGSTVHAIVLEIPDSVFVGLVGAHHPIGFWGTTTLATDGGGWRPINRMGQPMVQSIFNPPEEDRASDYNTTHPADDWANYGELFARLVARVVAAHGTVDDPPAYGALVARMLLPDILRYRVGSPASYSFATRNGRGLTDNAPAVMFSLVTNCALSDGLSRHDAAGRPRPEFPYVAASPHRKDHAPWSRRASRLR